MKKLLKKERNKLCRDPEEEAEAAALAEDREAADSEEEWDEARVASDTVRADPDGIFTVLCSGALDLAVITMAADCSAVCWEC